MDRCVTHATFALERVTSAPSQAMPTYGISMMADLQAAIQAALEEMVASGAETGLQVAVLSGGRVAAEAVSGVADPGTGAPVRAGTLFYAASTAKGVATSLAHVLAERAS